MDARQLGNQIRKDLATGVPKGSSLRSIRQFVMDVERSNDPAALLNAGPGSAGDERWDAFLAGVGEYVAVNAGIEVPAWTDVAPLDPHWHFSDFPKTHPIAFAETPAPLARRGVFIRQASLVNV